MIHEAHDRAKPTQAELDLADATEVQYARERMLERLPVLRAMAVFTTVVITLWFLIPVILTPDETRTLDNLAPLPQTNPVCVLLEDKTMAEVVAMQVQAGADSLAALNRNTQVAEDICPEHLAH